MTTILIADDHVMIRDGLKLLLSMQPGWEVVGETGDGAEVERLVEQTRPDLILLDLDLPNCHGEKITADIRAKFDTVKILIITGMLDPESARRALTAGADGYVLKQGDSGELIHAVQDVIDGKQYVSQGIAALFAHQNLAQSAADANEAVTPREQEIMRMIASGLSNDEIATALNRSVLTVRKHRQNMMDKLGLRNAAEITAYAIKHGFYAPK